LNVYPEEVGRDNGGAGEDQSAGTAPLIACTLEPGAVPDRLKAWRTILEDATSRTTAEDGSLHAEFGDTGRLGEVGRLVEAELHCCAFLSFGIVADHRGFVLDVRAPEGAGDVISAIFG
jgi:hypothetical protein